MMNWQVSLEVRIARVDLLSPWEDSTTDKNENYLNSKWEQTEIVCLRTTPETLPKGESVGERGGKIQAAIAWVQEKDPRRYGMSELKQKNWEHAVFQKRW